MSEKEEKSQSKGSTQSGGDLGQLISSPPLFSRLPKDQQQSFINSLPTPPIHFKAGETIANLSENHTPYLILNGNVSLYSGKTAKSADSHKKPVQCLDNGDIIS